MTDGYSIEKYKEVQIYLSGNTGYFNAEINDKEIDDKTLEGIRAKIDRQIKTDIIFKPIEAIQAIYDRRVVITSTDYTTFGRSYGPDVWVKFIDGNSYRQRGKESLGINDFAKATPENLAILEEIRNLIKQKEQLETKISELRHSYKEYVTKADLSFEASPIKGAKPK